MSRTRYKFLDGNRPYFITSTVVGWLPLFASPHIVDIVVNSLKFLQNERDLSLFAYVIMVNHVHLIVASENVPKDIGNFRSYTARRIVDYLERKKAEAFLEVMKFFKAGHKKDREYQVWQEGLKPKVILDKEMMLQKINYIHNNPVRSGLVDDSLHWRYSSARNFVDLPAVLEIVDY